MPPSIQTLLILLAAYLLGSLSGSRLFGRLRSVDMRTDGSSAGDADALRTQGWAFALAVVAFDAGKGALAAWLALRLAPLTHDVGVLDLSVTAHGYAALFMAAIGHVWPLWHGFRGGKGAATLVGGVLVLWPWIAPLLFLVWAVAIMLGGYVGVATVAVGLALVLLAWWSGAEDSRLWFSLAAALLLLFTHRGNLRRLLDGSESRFERARLLHRLWRRGA